MLLKLREIEIKPETKRKIVFAFLIVITAAIQNTPGFFPKINGASALIIIPLVTAVSMFEREITGMMFGVLAGFCWDFYSSHIDGYYIIILALAGFVFGCLINRYMRNNIMTFTVFSVSLSFICISLYWLIFVVLNRTPAGGLIYLRVYLPDLLYTVVISPVYYYFIRMIADIFRQEEEEK